MKTIAWAAKEG